MAVHWRVQFFGIKSTHIGPQPSASSTSRALHACLPQLRFRETLLALPRLTAHAVRRPSLSVSLLELWEADCSRKSRAEESDHIGPLEAGFFCALLRDSSRCL